MSTPDERFHLRHDGALLELAARREGLRTRVALFRDGARIAEGAGTGKVLVRLNGDGGADGAGGAGGGPTVLALGVLPGTVHRALLLVPPDPSGAPDSARDSADPAPPALDDVLTELPRSVRGVAGLATMRRRRFAPPPGTPAARLLAFERGHPRLWASRHVVLAVVRVVAGVLGLSAFVQYLLAPLLSWILGVLRSVPRPDVDLPDIPWPEIPWPDVDLPDLVAPGWLLFLVGTAKFWGPVLVATGLAVLEVRRRRRSADRTEEDRGAHR